MNPPEPPLPPVARSLLGGVLMGLANLVPGISGGTMILAIGLYERFIGAVADVTRLRFTPGTVLFLGLIALGMGGAVTSLSGPAVYLVSSYRWAAYSLFIGMTLGGAPQLFAKARPVGLGSVLAFALATGFIILLAVGLQDTTLPQTKAVLIVVGAAAASSMILPGVSGSYVLLILGMYDLVIGSVSSSALREDWRECMAVIAPVGVGAVLGIALLSNVLKGLLERSPSASHAALLGLLVGSVFGLYPFREAVYPELGERATRKAIVMVLDGAEGAQIREKYGEEFDDERLDAMGRRYSGLTSGELKRLSQKATPFQPELPQIGLALLLLVAGFGITVLISSSGGEET